MTNIRHYGLPYTPPKPPSPWWATAIRLAIIALGIAALGFVFGWPVIIEMMVYRQPQALQTKSVGPFSCTLNGVTAIRNSDGTQCYIEKPR